MRDKEEELNRRERELQEKERIIEEMERQVQEMLRLKKYSGSSTNAGTDGVNDSCIQAKGNVLSAISEADPDSAHFFTSS